jgi:hypothetical protein
MQQSKVSVAWLVSPHVFLSYPINQSEQRATEQQETRRFGNKDNIGLEIIYIHGIRETRAATNEYNRIDTGNVHNTIGPIWNFLELSPFPTS